VRASFSLSGLADHPLTLNAGWSALGFLTKALCLFGKTLFKRLFLLETSSHHDANPLLPAEERQSGMCGAGKLLNIDHFEEVNAISTNRN
jgi:hypothetical protein